MKKLKTETKKAKELVPGDVVWLKASPALGHAIGDGCNAAWYTVKRISKTSSSGGCRVSVWVEGTESSLCWLRGSASVRLLLGE